MPKQVFNKISYERQIKLLKPSIKEFVSKPYEKVTVASLTETMKILRTDFYYYFEGKDDIYDILLKDLYGIGKEVSANPTIEDAMVGLFDIIVKINGTRNKTFVLDLTQNYNPQFAYYLAPKLNNQFNITDTSPEATIDAITKIYKFMSVVSLYLKLGLDKDVAVEILKKKD